jgi:hypothetical protein
MKTIGYQSRSARRAGNCKPPLPHHQRNYLTEGRVVEQRDKLIENNQIDSKEAEMAMFSPLEMISISRKEKLKSSSYISPTMTCVDFTKRGNSLSARMAQLFQRDVKTMGFVLSNAHMRLKTEPPPVEAPLLSKMLSVSDD